MHYLNIHKIQCLTVIAIICMLGATAACAKANTNITNSPDSSAASSATVSSDSSIDPASTTTSAGPTMPSDPDVTSTPTATPTLSAEIVFDMTGDQSSSYREQLFVDANSDSIGIVGGGRNPVLIEGAIANSGEYYNQTDANISHVEYAMDGSSLAILLDYNKDKRTARLVYSDGQTYTTVAKDVDSFHLSDDGSTILYLSGRYEHGIGGDLYLYDCSTGKSRLITGGAGRLFTLSPSGNAISYTTFYEVDNPDALTCYVSSGEKSGENKTVLLDTDSYCAALTDDAATVYYIKKTDDGEIFTVNYKGTNTQLSSPYISGENYDYDHSLCFNTTHTQAVFTSGNFAYFTMSGADPVKISSVPVRRFAAGGYRYFDHAYLYETIFDSARSTYNISIYGTKNLCFVPFLMSDGSMIYFDDKMNVTVKKLTMTTYIIRISDKSMYVSNEFGEVIFTDYMDPNAGTITGFVSPTLTKDQTLYYLSPNESSDTDANSSVITYDLHVKFDAGEDSVLASGVRSIYLLEKDGADMLYFLVAPPESEIANDYIPVYLNYCYLYAVEEIPGAKPVLVAKKVYTVEVGDFGIIYRQYKSTSPNNSLYSGSYSAIAGVYYSKDGTSFQSVMKRPYIINYGG